VVAVLVFAHRRAEAGDCADARSALFSTALQHAEPPAAAVRGTIEHCRDPESVAVAAQGLTATGHPEVAVTLAREAVRRGPDEFASWAALALALRGSDPAGSARAARRAQALNPRWEAPAPRG
jgi:hypothetical protein